MSKHTPKQKGFFPTPEDDCINWQGAKSPQGYGKINYDGKTWLVHRLIFTKVKGFDPKHNFICHSCDNPSCINPTHLFLGNVQQNQADMRRKGRSQRYETNKTHCPQGHPYSKENTYLRGKSRGCRACNAQAVRKYKKGDA